MSSLWLQKHSDSACTESSMCFSRCVCALKGKVFNVGANGVLVCFLHRQLAGDEVESSDRYN